VTALQDTHDRPLQSGQWPEPTIRRRQLKVSISSTFNSRLFARSVLRSFSLVTVWLEIFCQKNIEAKADCKILMKLTQGAPISDFADRVYVNYPPQAQSPDYKQVS